VKRTSEQHLSMRPALGSHEGSLEEQYMRVAKEGAEGVLQIAGPTNCLTCDFPPFDAPFLG